MRPDIFPELSDDELYDLLMARVREHELAKQAQMRRDGRRFKGEQKLAKEQWDRPATSWEDRFVLTPKVAASCRWKRQVQIQRNRPAVSAS